MDFLRENCLVQRRGTSAPCVVSLLVGLLVVAPMAGGLSGTAVADGTVGKVFVFNGGANNEGKDGDGFQTSAQGWIFEQMGLLGPNGEPPTVEGDDLKKPDGTIVGKVLRDENNKIIGYDSTGGKMRAYNVDVKKEKKCFGGTNDGNACETDAGCPGEGGDCKSLGVSTADAWNAVAQFGELVIAKHGNKGLITLDQGFGYAGFKPEGGDGGGTGIAVYTPYELPPRPGANIRVQLNSCFSSTDPDDDDSEQSTQKPVTESAEDVPGVFSTEGYEAVTIKVSTVSWVGTQKQMDAASEKLKQCAKKAGKVFTGGPNKGEGDLVKWVFDLKFPEQLAKIKECIAGTGAVASINYEKNPPDCPPGTGGAAGCYYLCVTTVGKEGADLIYLIGPDHPKIEVFIPPGALSGPNAIFLHPTNIDDVDLPPSTQPATYPVEVRNYDGASLQFQLAATLKVTFPIGDEIVGFFQLLPDGTLVSYPANIDSSNGFVTADIFEGGTFLTLKAIDSVPTVSEWGLVVMSLLMLTAGTLVYTRRPRFSPSIRGE